MKDVRERLAKDHHALRGEMNELEVLASRLAESTVSPLQELKIRARALVAKLCQHMQWEDQEIVPMLQQNPDGGAGRAAAILAHHEEQRGQIRELLQQIEDPYLSPANVARKVLRLIDDVRIDMAEEDADFPAQIKKSAERRARAAEVTP